MAIKVIRRDFLTTPGARERFLREARTAARLHHPNVVAVHDVHPGDPETGEEPFLVMELCDGGSLADRLAASVNGAIQPDEHRRPGVERAPNPVASCVCGT